MNEDIVIQINGLKVNYGKQEVIRNLDATIAKGKIIGLIGPSGSGKTTLVKSIVGISQFQKGTIKVFNHSVPSLDVMRKIGYMAQNDALYDDLSGMDNLVFFGRICGMTGKQANKKALELLEFVGLEQDGKKVVRDYSGGMRRRLSLAIALINSPELLLLDEPTVGIDPVLRNKFWDEFKYLKDFGCTILVTTHVMDEAVRCDSIMLMRDGEIIATGTHEELLRATGTDNLNDAFLAYCHDEWKVA